MKLKRFTAPTMPEAIKLIKHDLGENAVILSTRKITGTNGQKGLEITAAIEQADTPPAKNGNPSPQDSLMDKVLSASLGVTSPQALTPLSARLIEHGVLPEYAQRITKAVTALEETGFSCEEGLEMVLSKLLQFDAPDRLLNAQKPLVLVGPTGAGKTTTLAKLAVSERMHGQNVAIVSLDTYKIGGIEQLGIYADALKEELHVVNGKQNFTAVLDKTKNHDLVLVDSAGTNPYEPSRMADTAKHIAQADGTVALVIPCNLNTAEMMALPRAFKQLNPQHLIFSKLDETVFLGGMINTGIESELPLCFMTDGQRVPQDLLQIDAKSLSHRLLAKPTMPWEAL